MVYEGGVEITTCAGKGGSAGNKMNGFYTWARLGYDATLDAPFRRRLPPELAGAKTVQDLMATNEGAGYWKRKGYMVSMRFDTTPGSRSIHALNRYLASKGEPLIDDGPDVVALREREVAERRSRVEVDAAARRVRSETQVPAALRAENARLMARTDTFTTYRGGVSIRADRLAGDPAMASARGTMAPEEFARHVYQRAEREELAAAVEGVLTRNPDVRPLLDSFAVATGFPPERVAAYAGVNGRLGRTLYESAYNSLVHFATGARGIPPDRIPPMPTPPEYFRSAEPDATPATPAPSAGAVRWDNLRAENRRLAESVRETRAEKHAAERKLAAVGADHPQAAELRAEIDRIDRHHRAVVDRILKNSRAAREVASAG